MTSAEGDCVEGLRSAETRPPSPPGPQGSPCWLPALAYPPLSSQIRCEVGCEAAGAMRDAA